MEQKSVADPHVSLKSLDLQIPLWFGLVTLIPWLLMAGLIAFSDGRYPIIQNFAVALAMVSFGVPLSFQLPIWLPKQESAPQKEAAPQSEGSSS